MPVTRRPWSRYVGLLVALAICTPHAFAQWVEFVDETDTRLNIPDASLGVNDPEEKDYAWGDVDNDGDTDLVIVRKEPFTAPGKEPNLLLINENGVLTDRTEEFASASDVPGDQGFLTPTNDRDVALVDVDLDGWLDIVTAPAISIDDPKHIGYPRIYHNRGCSGDCDGTEDWLGFRHEDARIPEMLSYEGQPGFNPCLCHVATGDVTGDGYPDLWLIDYDSGCGQPGADFNNKLLVNQGPLSPGYFSDVTMGRFFGDLNGEHFPVSAFGASGAIVDLNGDDVNDLVKQYASFVGDGYNDPFNQGFFDSYESPYGGSVYFVNTADLNNDDMTDMLISDDGDDRYLLNQGNGSDDMADFLSYTFSFNHTGVGGAADDDGFSGNSVAADLDKDGWDDVVMTDVDVDAGGCGRRTHIYRNLGGEPGGQVALQEQTTGMNCQQLIFGNHPACIVTTIPADKLEGTHDAAIFDINGDNWPDMVLGRCSGMEVYINVPPVGPAGSIPNGDVPGSMLTVDRDADSGLVTFSWGESCITLDTDYAIYEGQLGDFTSHSEVVCSTLGASTQTIATANGDSYYLVVPNNGTFEGSYGYQSKGTARQQGSSACYPMSFGTCE